MILNPGKHFRLRAGDIGLFLASSASEVDDVLSAPVDVATYDDRRTAVEEHPNLRATLGAAAARRAAAGTQVSGPSGVPAPTSLD